MVTAAALAVGIVADAKWGLVADVLLLMAGVVCLVCWRSGYFPAFRGRFGQWLPGFSLGAGALLAVAAAGGIWHQATWNWVPGDSLLRFATRDAQAVRLEGVCQTPTIYERSVSSFGPPRRSFSESQNTETETSNVAMNRIVSRCMVTVEFLGQAEHRQAVQGLVQVDVEGETPRLQPGDRLVIYGKLVRPAPPMNPGEFDYAGWLHGQGISGLVRVKHPEAIQRNGHQVGWPWWPRRMVSLLRQRAENGLESLIHQAPPELAISILLGGRQRLDPELRDSFIRSGMLHILAVSGMNVGLVVLLVMILSKPFVRHPWALAGVGVASIAFFLLLAENDPPVVRAAIFGCAWIIGSRVAGVVEPLNLLGFTAVLILVAAPHDLMQLGVQLSFLAVGTLILVSRVLQRRAGEAALAREDAPAALWQRGLSHLRPVALTTLAIWCLTTPLIAATSGVVSPVGLLLNVLLVPLVPIVMWSGYLTLMLALIHPVLGYPTGIVFDWTLSWLIMVVEPAASWQWGHFVMTPLPWELTVGFYAAVAAWLAFPRRRGKVATATLLLGICWLGVGLVPREQPLRVAFLSVGHGLAVLVETPDQRTWLYDAGSLGQERRAARTISQAVRHRGYSSLDAVTISHADADHGNAIPLLTHDLRIRWMGLPGSAADPGQRVMGDAVAAVKGQGGRLQLVAMNQRLKLSDEVAIEFVWPPEGSAAELAAKGRSDNSQSLVAMISYAGRRILLTGDLEDSGLDALLKSESQKVDVLLAPHHGGRRSNIAALNDWAQPSHVVSSQGPSDVTTGLSQTFPDAALWITSRQGAITVEVEKSGELRVIPFLREKTSKGVGGETR